MKHVNLDCQTLCWSCASELQKSELMDKNNLYISFNTIITSNVFAQPVVRNCAIQVRPFDFPAVLVSQTKATALPQPLIASLPVPSLDVLLTQIDSKSHRIGPWEFPVFDFALAIGSYLWLVKG